MLLDGLKIQESQPRNTELSDGFKRSEQLERIHQLDKADRFRKSGYQKEFSEYLEIRKLVQAADVVVKMIGDAKVPLMYPRHVAEQLYSFLLSAESADANVTSVIQSLADNNLAHPDYQTEQVELPIVMPPDSNAEKNSKYN